MMRRNEQKQRDLQRKKFLAGQSGISNSSKPLSNRVGFNQKENADDEFDMSADMEEGINDSRIHTSNRSRGLIDRSFSK